MQIKREKKRQIEKKTKLETSNWNVRIQRGRQNVWLRGKTMEKKRKEKIGMSRRPCLLFCTAPGPRACACTYVHRQAGRAGRQAGSRVCHMATVYKQSVLPLLDTGAILASPSDAHRPSVRSPCRGLPAKVTGSHSSASLAFCPRVGVARACACPPVRRACVHARLGLVCLSCHKLHSEASREELR